MKLQSLQFSGIYSQRPPQPVRSFQATFMLDGERRKVWGVNDQDGFGFEEVEKFMTQRDIIPPSVLLEKSQNLWERRQPLTRLQSLLQQAFENAIGGTDNSR